MDVRYIDMNRGVDAYIVHTFAPNGNHMFIHVYNACTCIYYYMHAAIGAAIAPTSLGFSAKLLEETGRLQSTFGQMVCAAAGTLMYMRVSVCECVIEYMCTCMCTVVCKCVCKVYSSSHCKECIAFVEESRCVMWRTYIYVYMHAYA